MNDEKLGRRRGTRTLARTMLAMGLAVAAVMAAPQPVSACGMKMFYGPKKKPVQLVAEAGQHLEAGRAGLAHSLAQRVVDDRRAKAPEKAQAWAIIGWVRWQRGERLPAMAALAVSRMIQPSAMETVLEHVRDPVRLGELRKVLTA